MDEEALKRQLFDEIHTQFETKLREAKKQKSQVEEELESVSERWRTERRRLNAEIDRLESALTEAKSARRREPSNVEIQGVDPLEVAKIQAAADDRVKQAEMEWESERLRLRNEIARLQAAVAEIIERANNPMRAAQPAKEQAQTRIDDAVNARQQLEKEFNSARILWEEEKLTMTAEIVELRLNAPSGAVLKARRDDADRRKDLDRKLNDAVAGRETADKEHAAERQLLNGRLEEAAAQVERSKAEILQLQGELIKAKDAASLTANDLEARLAGAARGHETADKEHARERELLSGRLEKAAAQVERSKAEILQLQGELIKAKDAASLTANDLEARLAGAARGHETADKEHARERELLSGRLEKAAAQVERSKAEILQLESKLIEAKDAASAATNDLEARLAGAIRGHETADKEHAQERELLNGRLEEAAGQVERSKAEILQLQGALIEARDAMSGNVNELVAKLATASRERETDNNEHAQQSQRLNARLEEAAVNLEVSKAESFQLQRELTEAKDAMSASVNELEARLAEAIHGRQTAADEHAQERQLLNVRLEEAAGQLERTNAEILQLQGELREANDVMSAHANALEAKMAGVLREHESADIEHAQERQSFNALLEEAAAQLERSKAEILQLQRELIEAKDAMSGNTNELLAKLASANSGHETANGEHAQERQILSAQLQEAAGQLERSKAEIVQVQGELSEAKDAMSANASALEAKMTEALRKHENADNEHAQERQSFNALLEEAAAQLERSKAEILQLQRELIEAKDAMSGNTNELLAKLASANSGHETASGEHARERQILSAQLQEAAGQLERSKVEIVHLQGELSEAKDVMSANASALDAKMAGALRELENADNEHAQERQSFNALLEEAAAQLERSKAEILQLQRELIEAKDAMSGNTNELLAKLASANSGHETANGEHARERQILGAQLQEAAGQLERSKVEIVQLQGELREAKDVMSANANALEAKMAEALREHENADNEHAQERQSFNALLEETAAELERSKAEILQLQRELIEAKDAMSGNADELLAKLAGAVRDHESADKEHAQERQSFNALFAEAAGQLEQSKVEILQLQSELAETKGAVGAGVVDQLQRQYDGKLHEITQKNIELAEGLRNASSLLEEERSRSAVAVAPSSTEAIDSEVERVELMIAEIAKLIDDPNTELSIVIRKNVERATLDAYLKGIFLSTGRSGG